eukprot:1154627-Pelagomonas_calceolata.AAC.3
MLASSPFFDSLQMHSKSPLKGAQPIFIKLLAHFTTMLASLQMYSEFGRPDTAQNRRNAAPQHSRLLRRVY